MAAQFPGQVWDGLSPTRDRKDQVGAPDVADFEVMRSEIQATQVKVLELDAAPSGAMSYSALTADATLVANTRYTNTGAADVVVGTLDAAAEIGDTIEVVITAAQPFNVLAPTGVTIRTSAFVTGAAGYLRSSRLASKLVLTKTSSTTWFAEATGTWANTSTTSAGFAFTPTTPVAWTPTSDTWLANVTFTGEYWQEGWTIHSRITATLSGTPTTAQLTINNWAGGFTPSTTKFPQGTRWTKVFDGGCSDTSAAGSSAAFITASAWLYSTDGALYFFVHSASATNDAVVQNVPWDWASGDTLTVYASYAVD